VTPDHEVILDFQDPRAKTATTDLQEREGLQGSREDPEYPEPLDLKASRDLKGKKENPDFQVSPVLRDQWDSKDHQDQRERGDFRERKDFRLWDQKEQTVFLEGMGRRDRRESKVILEAEEPLGTPSTAFPELKVPGETREKGDMTGYQDSREYQDEMARKESSEEDVSTAPRVGKGRRVSMEGMGFLEGRVYRVPQEREAILDFKGTQGYQDPLAFRENLVRTVNRGCRERRESEDRTRLYPATSGSRRKESLERGETQDYPESRETREFKDLRETLASLASQGNVEIRETRAIQELTGYQDEMEHQDFQERKG